jgi:YjbR protein
MNIHDFRRLALSLPGAEESSHMGSPDFRVGNRIFATLAAAKLGYGNIMITPDQQAAFVEDLPEIFIPVAGGWGRGGATHINLAVANEDVVLGALQTAHKLRLEKNAKSGSKPPVTKSKSRPTQKKTTVRKSKAFKTKARRSNK